MSRIGRLPIHLDKSIKASIAGGTLKVEGPKGKLELKLHPGFTAEIKDGEIVVKRPGDTSEERAIHGLMRKLVANMVEGVTKGYEKSLEIVGVGYRAETKPFGVTLVVGYSHPVDFKAPAGITIKAEQPTVVKVAGSDKELVGRVAAEIRAVRPPEPYKGKGIRYSGEHVRRKAGKTGAGATK